MARGQIETFQAPAPALDADRAYASPDAFAAPGLALQRLGGAIERLGETAGQLAVRRPEQYGLDHWAEATTQWQDALQPGVEEARQSGNWKGFSARLREQMDRDLATRIEGAPDGMVAARLKRRFAVLTEQVGRRAATFEHGMEILDAQAKLHTGLDGLAKLVYRDPTLAPENFAQGNVTIDDAARAGNLNPEQERKLKQGFANSLWGAALDRGLETDPFNTAKAINAGTFDEYLDLPTLERLKGKIDRSLGDAAAQRALSGVPIGAPAGGGGPKPDATDAEADAALAPIIQRESGGKPFVGYTPPGQPLVDLSKAPLDDTGFPVWQGNMGPAGISHAAGLYQFQPRTWRPIARQLGIKDFSAESQHKVARELYRREGLAPWAASEPGATRGGGGLAELYRRIDGMGLSEAAALRAKEQARVGYNALEADAQRRERDQARAAQAVVRQAEDEIIADAYSDQPKITAQQVANDPRFASDPERRLKMIEVVRKAGQAGPAAGVSHMEALGLLDRIRRPAGDPDKITDVRPIYDALIANRITKADFDFVKREFDQIRTPAGEVFGKRKTALIQRISPLISKSNLLMGNHDPEGDAQLYNFEWMLDQKIDEYRKAGKNPGDLIDPTKPDFVGRPEFLMQFQTTFQEAMRAKARQLKEVPAYPLLRGSAPPASAPAPPAASGAPVATAPIPAPSVPGVPPRKPGESPADYLKRIGAGLPPASPAAQPPVAR